MFRSVQRIAWDSVVRRNLIQHNLRRRRPNLRLEGRCPRAFSSSFDASSLGFGTGGRGSGFGNVTSSFGGATFDEAPDELEKSTTDDEKKRLAEEKRKVLLQKKGRGWTDPWDIDEMLESTLDHESLPDWAPSLVSRISQERVQIYNVNGSKIPLLSDLAVLPLPLPPPPTPGLGQTKAYALYRKRAQYKYVLEQVKAMAEPHIQSILSLNDWQDKQDAVDVLFEDIERSLKEREVILGKHPTFGLWVERALEEYLKNVRRRITPEMGTIEPPTTTTTSSEGGISKAELRKSDETAVPIFMDCYMSGKGDSDENAVPHILNPLKPNSKGQSVGRMVEEWELSAQKSSKRIMLRQCTRQIAQALVSIIQTESQLTSSNGDAAKDDESNSVADVKDNDTTLVPSTALVPSSARIFVHGRQGVGKSAAIAAIVASARVSGCIVLYMPEGNQLHKNGFYIEPNARRPGIFDLPILSKGVCQNMVDAHRDELIEFTADSATMEMFFTDDELSRFKGYTRGESISLDALLSYGADKVDMAAMCFAAAVDVLKRQNQKPFLMVLDEFNCFFQPGQYFHGAYDMDGHKPIPYVQISLFRPILQAIALGPYNPRDDATAVTTDDDDDVFVMQRGAVIVGTTESHAVARSITDSLTAHVEMTVANTTGAGSTTDGDEQSHPSVPLHVIAVPHLSALEVEHMLSHYEATGVGRLRLDRGETVMNAQEVNFLRMVSGGEAQRLMNACML